MNAHQNKESVILIVDDDRVSLSALAGVLEARGHHVVTTLTSFGVLNLIARDRPRLVILDVSMPGLGGPALLELVRRDPELASTRVVLDAAMPDAALSAEAQRCGADDFISKSRGLTYAVQKLSDLLV
jgi:PleD family two-component response regulator